MEEDAFVKMTSEFEAGKKMKGVKSVENISRSACDALMSYFTEMSFLGETAKVDYRYIANMLSGEGGKPYSCL